MKSAHEYQRKAEECRQRASCAVHPDDKAGWLLAAQDWQNLARCVEQSAEQRGLAAALSAAHVRGAANRSSPNIDARELSDVDH